MPAHKVKSFTCHGDNGLIVACKQGNTDLVRRILHYPQVQAIIDERKYSSPLTVTCRRGHCDIFDILVGYGADINKTDGFGCTPLAAACEGNRLDIIDRLLILGANVNLHNQYQEVALFGCRSVDAFYRLYVYGADLKAIDYVGNTVLHVYVNLTRVPSIPLISELLNYYPECVHITNNKGDTALAQLHRKRICNPDNSQEERDTKEKIIAILEEAMSK